MDDYVNIPDMPGYIPIKGAARLLNVSVSRVYDYIQDGRLPAVWAGNTLMLSLEEVKNFKPKLSGRPRTTVPLWRISPRDNTLLRTVIRVAVRSGKQAQLMEHLDAIRRNNTHLFPGTLIRYIAGAPDNPQEVEIVLIWRSSVMPDEATHEAELAAFREALADVLDWSSAQYTRDVVYMHT